MVSHLSLAALALRPERAVCVQERRGKAMQKGIVNDGSQRIPRSSWIITHGAAGPALTPEMFFEYDSHVSKGMIMIDECYTTSDQVLNYTLIHTEKKIRQTNVQNFVEYIKSEHVICLLYTSPSPRD